MPHWLVESYNGLIMLTVYIDAIFTLAVLLTVCGLLILYDTIKRSLGRGFIH